MKIDNKLIEHIARLSRLKFSEAEKKTFARELSRVLEYVEKLKGLDLSKTEPLVHTLDESNVFRTDKTKPSLEQEKALGNAPDKKDGFFRVPRVIETPDSSA